MHLFHFIFIAHTSTQTETQRNDPLRFRQRNTLGYSVCVTAFIDASTRHQVRTVTGAQRVCSVLDCARRPTYTRISAGCNHSMTGPRSSFLPAPSLMSRHRCTPHCSRDTDVGSQANHKHTARRARRHPMSTCIACPLASPCIWKRLRIACVSICVVSHPMTSCDHTACDDVVRRRRASTSPPRLRAHASRAEVSCRGRAATERRSRRQRTKLGRPDSYRLHQLQPAYW